jgi:hypothetical protein
MSATREKQRASWTPLLTSWRREDFFFPEAQVGPHEGKKTEVPNEILRSDHLCCSRKKVHVSIARFDLKCDTRSV